MGTGCSACGARAVGPPLARPVHELPSYGSALATAVCGALLLLVFTAKTLAALLERGGLSLDLWDFISAAETAAWRLKWFALPFAAPALWLGWRACARIRREPTRYTGGRMARAGVALSACVALGIALLIGVTIPERLRQRQIALMAADDALRYATHGALLQYRARYGTYPANINDLCILPDPDGSIAKVLTEIKPGDYSPVSNIAASLPPATAKSRGRRGSIVRLRAASARVATDDLPDGKFSLTNYELALPGRDQVPGTADDLKIRDGMFIEDSSSSMPPARRYATTNITAPE